MSVIVKLKIKKDDNISKYVQILRGFDSTLSSHKIRESIENYDFIMEYDVIINSELTEDSKEEKIENLFYELSKAGAILEIYTNDNLKTLDEYKDYLKTLKKELKNELNKKIKEEKVKIQKAEKSNKKFFENFKGIFLGILLLFTMYGIALFLSSTPIGIGGVIKYVIWDILLLIIVGLVLVLWGYEYFRKNNKSTIKTVLCGIVGSIIAVISLYNGCLNGINLGKDLIQGTKEDTFYDIDVYMEGGRRSYSRFMLEVRRSDGKELNFKIDYNTYMTAEKQESVTITYYENSAIIMDIDYIDK